MNDFKGTRGPWRWQYNPKRKELVLQGGSAAYGYTVMEFCRVGMNGAGVTLSHEEDGVDLLHKFHERADWIAPIKGREHHSHWMQAVNHPDLKLMESSPDLLEALQRIMSIFHCPTIDSTSEEYREWYEAKEIANAALSKALGQ